jgi:transcriptional regulator with XRE-family HTH domain
VYDFSSDLQQRMKAANLTASALAERGTISHTAVGKWLSGEARPQGKERMKMLGMALGMSAAEIDTFLYTNGYPKLHAKNPLDNACSLILKTHRTRPDIVSRYRAFLELYRVQAYRPASGRAERNTDQLGRSFEAVDSEAAFSAWMDRHRRFFGATAKTVTAGARLMRRVWLYIGEAPINDLYQNAELPLLIRNLLYSLLGNREVPVKGLRGKLIVFGLYENMTEEELDLLLTDAKLRGVSEPKTLLDQLVLTAIRTAHERYPYYEYETMQRLSERIRAGMLYAKDAAQAERFRVMLDTYEERYEDAMLRAAYYDTHKTKEDERFEELYTNLSDRRLLHYVSDVVMFFVSDGVIDQTDAEELAALMRE